MEQNVQMLAKQIEQLKFENSSLKLRIEELESSSQELCLVTGSSWESALQEKTAFSDEKYNEYIGSAFRQIKYELYCASVDLLGYSIRVHSNRNCSVRSVYFLDDSTKAFEFIYDHDRKSYTDLVWTDFAQEYHSIFTYWVIERQCIAGFLAAVFLENCSRYGDPPKRPRPK